MIIIKDKDKKEVTKGAYEQFQKPLGYKTYACVEAVYTEKVEEPKAEEKIETPIEKETSDKIKHVTGHKSSNKTKKGE